MLLQINNIIADNVSYCTGEGINGLTNCWVTVGMKDLLLNEENE